MATKIRKQKALHPIPENEIELAAKFLAATNLGSEVRGKGKSYTDEVLRAWNWCRQAHGEEGLEVGGELKVWQKLCQKQDAFCAAEWHDWKNRFEVVA